MNEVLSKNALSKNALDNKRIYNKNYSKKKYSEDPEFKARQQMKYYRKIYKENEDFNNLLKLEINNVEKIRKIKMFHFNNKIF